ncbi:Uncharacterised protein [Mycobacteroides abscessus]|nr:Uncharacterised protein [Mycobacteroides abscessus]
MSVPSSVRPRTRVVPGRRLPSAIGPMRVRTRRVTG